MTRKDTINRAIKTLERVIKENKDFKDVTKKAMKAEKDLKDYLRLLNKQEQLVKDY